MYEHIQIKKLKPSGRNLFDWSPLRRGFIPAAFALALAWIVVSPTAQAVSPAPDGGYPNGNTAEGEDALFSLTTGPDNTAIGFNALFSNTTGDANTANGLQALLSNTTGGGNTATGVNALEFNTTGFDNTANGVFALQNNTTGSDNTANGLFAATRNTTGTRATANGFEALFSNTTGSSNTANGAVALASNTTGFGNTADGDGALARNTTGKSNIAVGFEAGSLTTGSDNIDIGNPGRTGEAKTIRIGKQATQMNTFIAGISGVAVAGGVGVIVDTKGHLGTVVSSARFKESIEPMNKASEAILALKPVTFHYKPELDPRGIPQFGLVAEQVAKVNPDLVARDDQGKPYTVRYEAVNAMLLNEFLKEHSKVEAQEATITQLKEADATLQATGARQQKEITALTAGLKTQAAQIQKVSDQLKSHAPASRVVMNNRFFSTLYE